MASMSLADPLLPRTGEWTVDDLELLPNDGLQYELADGVLLVTPAPRPIHQRVLGNLYLLLRASVPAGFEVFLAPLDFQPTRQRSLQPDVLVVRREDVGEKAIERPLLLAVEILSPSTRAKDLILKRELYASSGVASYWIVDPDVPSITTWQLQNGEYAAERVASGDEELQVDMPYQVVIVPSSLIN